MTSADVSVWEGRRPAHSRDLTPETAGMAPVPASQRYARPWWMAYVWFTPNMEVSAVFIGTLGAVMGLGFGWGGAALAIGIILGALPVAYLSTWGPQTGTAQLPAARMPFGKSIVAPGLVQWLSAIGWISIGCYFGAQATHLLLHWPIWASALVVLALEAAISVWGYEVAVKAEKYGAVLMIAFFTWLTVRISQHHITLPVTSAHGGPLAAAFVLMIAIALSGSFSWASYGSDYSRYCPSGASRRVLFWATLAGISISYLWLSFLGLAAASVLGDQTAGGIAKLVGGGAIGDVALAAVAVAAFVSSAMNDYSGSLAFQAMGARIKRPVGSAIAAAIAFAIIMWMSSGAVATRFENVLLFTGYWLSPFTAIVLIDWFRNHRAYTCDYMEAILNWRGLPAGWPALIAFFAGFGCMVPFMDTSVLVGPVSRALDGADLAYYIGFIVTGVLYCLMLRLTSSKARSVTSSDQPGAAAAIAD